MHISNDQWVDVTGLQSNLEEADTRISLHVAHAAAKGYIAVVVTADDTDVLRSPPIYHAPCSRNAERRIGLGILTLLSYATP